LFLEKLTRWKIRLEKSQTREEIIWRLLTIIKEKNVLKS
jgi:hypothetical protein